jgi:hypothetical protein
MSRLQTAQAQRLNLLEWIHPDCITGGEKSERSRETYTEQTGSEDQK